MIVAFGNPVYDYIQTPAISTGQRVLSGCSTNGCLALTRLGRHTTLVGRIGADYYDRFTSDVWRYGVTPDVQLSQQTGGFSLVYDARGDRTLDVLGVAEPIEHAPVSCAEAEAIILGPIMQEISLNVIEKIRAISQAPLFLDPQGLLRQIGASGRIEHVCPPELERLAQFCHVIKANELETRVITGIDPRVDGFAAVRRLKSLGCAIAIVTLAEAGSLIDTGERQYAIPAYATEVRDPTGAGDTYMAGFIHAYLQDPQDMYGAGCMGAATASLWIEQTGPDAPLDLYEVERRTTALCAVAETL